MNWRVVSGVFLSAHFGAPAAAALLLQPPPRSDVTDISFRYLHRVYSSWRENVKNPPRPGVWPNSDSLFGLVHVHLKQNEKIRLLGSRSGERNKPDASENVSDWASPVKTFSYTDAHIKCAFLINYFNLFSRTEAREWSKDPPTLWVRLWLHVKHTLCVCFSDMCFFSLIQKIY